MLYEDMTYEVILQRMMDRVTEQYPNLDTREGSIIFNALAPAAIELAIMYTELDNARNESFVDTASREYLLIACDEIGMDISVFETTYGVHKAEFDVEVSIGSRWNCDIYNYTVLEYIGVDDNGKHQYYLQCETEGTSPNNTLGSLSAITEMPDGLTYAELVGCVIEGENETDDDSIRAAYKDYLKNSVSDGNVQQYKQWCSEYDGIGNCKVFPLWNGENTVKVSILSSSNQVASDDLINEFQEYLDPECTGMGNGVAPIGAYVTVATATEYVINVSADITLKPGYSDTSAINTALENYFTKIAYTNNIVSYMTLGSIIITADCVENVNNLLVNGGTDDITLGDEEIPTLGTTDWMVSN